MDLDILSNDTCQSEVPSRIGAKSVMAMKEKLPQYVMDCFKFIATGFDTLEMISEIDTSSEYGLQEIEQFITNEHIESYSLS